MAKNLANNYRDYNSVRRFSPNTTTKTNDIDGRYCSTCGSELIDNECVDCEIKDVKNRNKIKKKSHL